MNSDDDFVLELAGKAIELVGDAGAGNSAYRAKHEAASLRIGFVQDTSHHWVVFDRNGTKYTFGRQPGERGSRIDRYLDGSPHSTFAWLLETVEDQSGNRIEYYYEPPPAGETRPRGLPARIEYGGRGRKAHPFLVEFQWQGLPGLRRTRSSYKAGFAQRDGDVSLAAVRTYVVEREGARVVREYSMAYKTDEPGLGIRSLVAVSLRGYAPDGSRVDVPPSVFRYSPALQRDWPYGPAQERRQHAIGFAGPGEIRDYGDTIEFDTFDINGDAIPDYVDTRTEPPSVRLGTGSGLASPVAWSWPASRRHIRSSSEGKLFVAVLDLTGDGLPDLVDAGCGTSSQPQWCIYRNQGSGFALAPDLWDAPLQKNYLRKTQTTGSNTSATIVDTVDVDGDGRPDFVDASVYSGGVRAWRFVRNVGDSFLPGVGFFQAPLGAIEDHFYPDTSGCQIGWQRSGLIDLNGDGLRDLVVADPPPVVTTDACDGGGEWEVYYNNGAGFELSPVPWIVEDSGYRLPHYLSRFKACTTEPASLSATLLDMTGDSLPDLVHAHRYGTCGDDQHVGPLCESSACDPADPEFPENCCNNLILLANTGTSFAAPTGWGMPYTNWVNRFTYPEDYTTPRWELLDFDGDGLLDLLEHLPEGNPTTGQVTGHTWSLYRNPASPFATSSGPSEATRTRPNLLVAMMNGLGGETMLEYSPVSLLADSDCTYESGKAASGRCLPFPYWVVTRRDSVDVFAGLVYQAAQPETERYMYVHPRYDGEMREFRGFGESWRVDPAGLVHVTLHHQDEARVGRVRDSWLLGNPGCGLTAQPASPQCNPWNYPLSHTHHEWSVVGSAPTTVAQLRRTVTTPYTPSSATETAYAREELIHVTNYEYDIYGNERTKTVNYVTEVSTTDGQRDLVPVHLRSQAAFSIDDRAGGDGLPEAFNVSKPARVLVEELGEHGRPLVEKRFEYKKGLLRTTAVCSGWGPSGDCLPSAWSETRFRVYKNGLVRGAQTPIGGKRKVRYGAHKLYASKVTNEARLKGIEAYDLGTGLPVRTVDEAGSERAVIYDGLGRQVEAWGPDFSSGSAVLLESETRYVAPYVDETDVHASQPGYVVHRRAGEAPIVVFYDGFGRRLATKTLRETESGLRILVAGLTEYDAAGRPVHLAVPFDSEEAVSELETLAPSLFDRVPGWIEQSYDAVTARRATRTQPSGRRVFEERSVPGVVATVGPEFGNDPERGSVTIELFDAANRRVRVDVCGLLPTRADLAEGCPAGHLLQRTSYSYDGLDRIVAVTQHALESPSRRILLRATEYDGLGNPVVVFDADSGSTIHEYNSSGALIRTLRPDGAEVAREYDRAGRLQTVRYGSFGSRATIEYQYLRRGPGAGKVGSIIVDEPGSGRIEKGFVYNARGLVEREWQHIRSVGGHIGDTAESSYEFHYSYELPARRTSVSYPSSSNGEPDVVTTTYSAFGHPKRVESSTSGESVVVEDASYDIFGRLTYVEYGNGIRDLYRYLGPEADGELVCLRTTGALGDACSRQSTDLQNLLYAARNARGQVTTVVDRLHSPGAQHTNYHQLTYDRLGRLVEVAYGAGGSEERESFEYDSIGNMVVFDGEQRLFDSVFPHRLISTPGRSFDYDANGNLVSDGISDQYVFDAFHRLQRVSRDGEVIQENVYDEDGTRVARYERTSGETTHYYGGLVEFEFQAGEVVRHYFLGNRRVASDRIPMPSGGSLMVSPQRQHTRSQAPTAESVVAAASSVVVFLLVAGTGLVILPRRRFARTAVLTGGVYLVAVVPLSTLLGADLKDSTDSWAPWGGARAARAMGDAGGRLYYHPDHLGSPQLLTDSSGSVLEYLRYRAYGSVRGVFVVREGSIVPKTANGSGEATTDYTFTAQRSDREVGLLYFGERFYSPGLASYLTHDPAEQFASPYAYAGFDPINGIDPDGRLFGLDDAALIFLAKLAAISSAVAFGATLGATGDLGMALEVGVRSGISTFVFGGLHAAVMRTLVVHGVLTQTTVEAFSVAQAIRGVYEADRRGNPIAGLTALATAAFGLTHPRAAGAGGSRNQRASREVSVQGQPEASSEPAHFLELQPAGKDLRHADSAHPRFRIVREPAQPPYRLISGREVVVVETNGGHVQAEVTYASGAPVAVTSVAFDMPGASGGTLGSTGFLVVPGPVYVASSDPALGLTKVVTTVHVENTALVNVRFYSVYTVRLPTPSIARPR